MAGTPSLFWKAFGRLVKVCGVGYVFVCFPVDVLSNASWKSRKLDTNEAFKFNF